MLNVRIYAFVFSVSYKFDKIILYLYNVCMQDKILNWIKVNFLMKKDFLDFKQSIINRVRNIESQMSTLKKSLPQTNESHIDLELFGIRLLRARLINVTKTIFISSFSMAIFLYFILRWLK